MKSTKIPCIYYPTTAIFVDDNKRFLNSFLLKINHRIPYKIYQDPKLALEYIKLI